MTRKCPENIAPVLDCNTFSNDVNINIKNYLFKKGLFHEN